MCAMLGYSIASADHIASAAHVQQLHSKISEAILAMRMQTHPPSRYAYAALPATLSNCLPRCSWPLWLCSLHSELPQTGPELL